MTARPARLFAATCLVVTALLSGALAQLPIGGAPAIGTYGLIAAIMIGIATLAAASPALRAATVDPSIALRQE